jgi:hypothetical protein
MQLQFAHFERGRVRIAQQVANQAAILMYLFRPGSVGNSRGLHNGRIVTHVIDDPDMAMIKDRKSLAENIVESANCRAVDVGVLHVIFLSVALSPYQ